MRQSKCLRILAAHSDPVTAVGFAPDGAIVVSASHDGLIRLWDTATGQCLKTLVSATKSPVMYVRFTPNGRYLLASTMDGCIRLWDYMKDKCTKTYLLRDETSDEDADMQSNRPTNSSTPASATLLFLARAAIRMTTPTAKMPQALTLFAAWESTRLVFGTFKRSSLLMNLTITQGQFSM